MNEGSLEERIAEWRQYFQRRQAVHSADIEEIEDHLRSQIGTLREAGLAEDEAFLVAIKRVGALDSLSREFASEYSERLWKQLVVSPENGPSPRTAQRETVIAEAYRKAQTIMGEGDAKAAAIYARAFSENPEFYAFYRSLDVYKKGFSNRSDVIVLDPNSEFFKYFKNPNRGAAGR